MTFLLRDNRTGKVYSFVNCIMDAWDGDDTGGEHTYATLTGRFFDPDHGYVDLTTPDPIKIYWDDKFPSAGILEADGANGTAGGSTKARLTAISDTSCRVDADTNGDDTFDYSSGTMSWSELGEDSTNTTFQIAEYFPLEQGDTWTYREEDSELTTQTISGTENIGGVDAPKKIDEDGDYELFTNSNGITLYKHYDADDISGCGWSERTFIPPVTLVPAEISIGSIHTSNSTYNYTECTGFSESASISLETTVVGFEDVTVTAGTFKDCLKIKMEITVNLPNDQVSIIDQTLWHAKGVGEVKSTSSESIDGDVTDVFTHDLMSADVGGVEYP
jgi:hypothetical protein